MNKITKTVTYKNICFDFIREVKGLSMYISKVETCCIIVDKDDTVLFEIGARCEGNTGCVEDCMASLCG
jgi:hypothetical protein